MFEKIPIPDTYKGMLLNWRYEKYHPSMLVSHHHDEVEVNLFTGGTGSYVINGRNYQVAHGSLLIFPSNIDHQLVKVSENFSMIVIVYRKNYLPQNSQNNDFIDLLSTGRTQPLLKSIEPSAYQDLINIANQLCPEEHKKLTPIEFLKFAGQTYGFRTNRAYYHPDPELFNCGLDFFFHLVWQKFLASDNAPAGAKIHQGIKQVCDLMHRATKHLSLDELAVEAGLSPSRLSRLFKQQMGISLTGYRNQLKIDMFLRLYTEHEYSDSNITSLAYQSGFGSYAQFYKVFKQICGDNPANVLKRKV